MPIYKKNNNLIKSLEFWTLVHAILQYLKDPDIFNENQNNIFALEDAIVNANDKKWVLVSSIGKVFYGCIRDLGSIPAYTKN